MWVREVVSVGLLDAFGGAGADDPGVGSVPSKEVYGKSAFAVSGVGVARADVEPALRFGEEPQDRAGQRAVAAVRVEGADARADARADAGAQAVHGRLPETYDKTVQNDTYGILIFGARTSGARGGHVALWCSTAAGTVRRMSSLNLDDFTDLIERPDGGVRRDAEARRERQIVPPGALGRLDDLGEWLAAAQGAVPVRPVERPRVVLFAGDHGIASLGVSGHPRAAPGELVRSVLEGGSPAAVLARRLGVPVRIVDMALDCEPDSLPDAVVEHRVRRGSGRIDIEDALTLEEAEAAFTTGVAVANEEADSGTDLVVLGDVSVGGTTPASVLIAALCGTDASVVTGRGGLAIDDLAWMRKCAAIRDALRRARPVLGDQLQLLATVGGADLAAMTGFLLQSAVRKLPVILDGVVAAACALVGQRVAFRAPDWWLA